MTADPRRRLRRHAVETVESVVRRQLGQALGGRRGMVEAAVPDPGLHRLG